MKFRFTSNRRMQEKEELCRRAARLVSKQARVEISVCAGRTVEINVKEEEGERDGFCREIRGGEADGARAVCGLR